jgi:hypothetical protein
MVIFKIKSVYLLHIYVTVCLVSSYKQHLRRNQPFKHMEYQYLNYLARDLLSEVIRGPHVEKFGDS